MKTTMKTATSLFLAFLLIVCATACQNKIDTDRLWSTAIHTADTTVGEGSNTVTLLVTAGERSITLKIQTEKATLGEALHELGLVNDPTFFDVCNGIKADWDKDQAYWSFYVGDEVATFGIGDAQAVTTGNPTYKIVYTQ